MVHTFYLWRCSDYTARAAEALGKTDDAKAYRELADRTAPLSTSVSTIRRKELTAVTEEIFSHCGSGFPTNTATG